MTDQPLIGGQLDAQERERRAQMLRDERAFAYFVQARAPIDAIVRDPVETMRATCEAIARKVSDDAAQSIKTDICGDPYGQFEARLNAADAIAERIAALKTEGTTT